MKTIGFTLSWTIEGMKIRECCQFWTHGDWGTGELNIKNFFNYFLYSHSSDDDPYFGWCSVHDIKLHLVVRLHFCRYGDYGVTPLFSLFLSQISSEVGVPVKVLCMVQIGLFLMAYQPSGVI